MRVGHLTVFFVTLKLITGYVETNSDTLTISKQAKDISYATPQRYLLYEVNFGEGFNLRRDVYMRVASLVYDLRQKGNNFVLVLPPWGNLYHWKDQARRVPWNKLFDVKSLNAFVPVMEFEEFLEKNSVIEQVLYLQHYAEGWTNGKWEERYHIRDCIDAHRYYKKTGNTWSGFVYSFENVKIKNLTCLSIQGETHTLSKAIFDLYPLTSTLFIDRAETVIHNEYGGAQYWQIRRSMRYAKDIRDIADEFRQSVLEVNPDNDNIVYPESWRDESDLPRTAYGGDYLAIHLRRKDFLRSHGAHVPDLDEAATQILHHTSRLGLSKVFVCSDADEKELYELKEMLSLKNVTLFRFISNTLSDGSVSIIDQWIAAKARYFLGTQTSTFSYRIREDREIMHFPVETTFNNICKFASYIGDKTKCEQPAKWRIVY